MSKDSTAGEGVQKSNSDNFFFRRIRFNGLQTFWNISWSPNVAWCSQIAVNRAQLVDYNNK